MESLAESSCQQLELLASKKMNLGENYAQVNSNIDGALLHNESYNIRVGKLSHLGSELDWLVKDGIVKIIEKLIELLEFLQGVRRINNMCFATGKESGREVLCKVVVNGKFDPSAASSTSIY
ncbi:unnamed protein product [Lactuca saligna]|uniref:Uncharacterized protein n=1 Tax=Lactuca saligna TaxID=75948 RepID=A0AA35ZQP7_LACSI|nr:unnamed protein product [Lactuca saligna]